MWTIFSEIKFLGCIDNKMFLLKVLLFAHLKRESEADDNNNITIVIIIVIIVKENFIVIQYNLKNILAYIIIYCILLLVLSCDAWGLREDTSCIPYKPT